ncbi:hypothetical protein SAMN05444483_101652 [Salegentibacter echinorum]|uniref:DUF4382 domain-containing protein n=1 Tax=Salegentibacter echinorum TaxID=1073325 RepID=A0A1M5CSX4_SALEC|nr:hypothetical protein [Salegentibacter echinorum]SHF57756.1 hypothetical protein SAMN05444483_101652 [Salegentibacter echinorum]
MKTIKYQIKTFFFLLFAFSSLAACSSDDDTIIDDNDNDGDLVEGLASAEITVDNETIQFSSKSEDNFAGVMKTKMGEEEIDQLVIVMVDKDSEVAIISQALPAPNSPIDYDLSKVGFGNDYFFTTDVVLDDSKVYSMGSYQQGDEIALQSEGLFQITSVSKDNIKGTFKMTLYNSYDPNNEDAKELTITEGKFDLPIKEIDEGDLGDLDLD